MENENKVGLLASQYGGLLQQTANVVLGCIKDRKDCTLRLWLKFDEMPTDLMDIIPGFLQVSKTGSLTGNIFVISLKVYFVYTIVYERRTNKLSYYINNKFIDSVIADDILDNMSPTVGVANVLVREIRVSNEKYTMEVVSKMPMSELHEEAARDYFNKWTSGSQTTGAFVMGMDTNEVTDADRSPEDIKLINSSRRADTSILGDPRVSTLNICKGNTPLHYLALDCVEVLTHPDVAVVKNAYGNTPLHLLAINGHDASSHPEFNVVKNNDGKTPSDYYELFKTSGKSIRRIMK